MYYARIIIILILLILILRLYFHILFHNAYAQMLRYYFITTILYLEKRRKSLMLPHKGVGTPISNIIEVNIKEW